MNNTPGIYCLSSRQHQKGNIKFPGLYVFILYQFCGKFGIKLDLLFTYSMFNSDVREQKQKKTPPKKNNKNARTLMVLSQTIIGLNFFGKSRRVRANEV